MEEDDDYLRTSHALLRTAAAPSSLYARAFYACILFVPWRGGFERRAPSLLVVRLYCCSCRRAPCLYLRTHLAAL